MNETAGKRDTVATALVVKLTEQANYLEGVSDRLVKMLSPYTNAETPLKTKPLDQIDAAWPPYFDALRCLTRRIENATTAIDTCLGLTEL